MTTLYLHIGTPKTGTTAIQKFLQQNFNFLKKQGYIYPDFGIYYKNIGEARNGHFLVLGEGLPIEYERILKKIKKISKKYNNIILSEEAIWNTPYNIKQFVQDMNLNNIKVKVVVYLRRQDLFLQSHWAQKVKEGSRLEFIEYVNLTKDNMDYYNQCCLFSNIVGKENMIIRVYEKQQFLGEQQNLLTDFFEVVGLNYDKKIDISCKFNNPSLVGIYLETKRMLNRYRGFRKKENFVIKYLYKIAKQKGDIESYSLNKYFTYEQQVEFLFKYDDTNQKVAREFLGREDGILFRDRIVKSEEYNSNYTTEQYIDILASIILKQQREIKKLEKTPINKLKNIKFLKRIKKNIMTRKK